MTLYKVLDPGRKSRNGGMAVWPAPKDGKQGRWTRRIAPRPCEQGWHLCDGEGQLLQWLGPEVWEAEARGVVVRESDKICAESARLVRRLAWGERIARLFACDCAERVAHLSADPRVPAAIAVARRFANSEATAEELAAAGDAARAAAGDAAGDAAWDAAWAAAWAAAGAAARDAARAAARAAAWAAAGAAARDAARAAARAAARDAARDAAWAAAGDAERTWQSARLRQCLMGEIS